MKALFSVVNFIEHIHIIIVFLKFSAGYFFPFSRNQLIRT